MIDLQKLADMPGAGKAKDVVKEAGFWNYDDDEVGQLYRGEGQEQMAFRRKWNEEGK